MASPPLLTADGTTPTQFGLELCRQFAKAVLAGDTATKIRIRQQVASDALAPIRHIIDDMDGDMGLARYVGGG